MSGEAFAAAQRALAGEADVWLVGGAVRDRLMGRRTDDVDLALPGDPKRHARAIAREAGGAAFRLSGAFGAWRVVGPGQAWHVDLVSLRDGDIHADLAHRDFTINAMAEPLGGGELLDPHGGRADLERPRGDHAHEPPLEVYRELLVREVWIFKRGRIEVHVLRGAHYQLVAASEALPGIDLDQLLSFLDRPTASQAIREYRAALRGA